MAPGQGWPGPAGGSPGQQQGSADKMGNGSSGRKNPPQQLRTAREMKRGCAQQERGTATVREPWSNFVVPCGGGTAARYGRANPSKRGWGGSGGGLLDRVQISAFAPFKVALQLNDLNEKINALALTESVFIPLL